MSAVDSEATAKGFAERPSLTDTDATAALLRAATTPATPLQLANASSPENSATKTTGAPLVGTSVGPYRIEAVIASGGMGTVYKAWQSEPVQRRVALKMIRQGMADTSSIQRFQIERQALAVMDHPDIARVFDAGQTIEGNPYFAMEFCEGLPIDEYCNERQLGIRDRIQLVVRIARAVQRAHNHGVIHRDLKPANVIVSDCEGRPNLKVIDFGIAKLADQAVAPHQATQIGELIGTPAYMSPEQAAGANIDNRADVFAIGALLFKLLTGETPLGPPPEGSGLADVIHHITTFEATTPSRRFAEMSEESKRSVVSSLGLQRLRQCASAIRGDLDWITLRATEANKLRRYATADDLADDLERFLNHQPVVAAAPQLTYRLHKLYQRHRAAVLASAAIVATLLLASGITGHQWYDQYQRDAREQHQVTIDAARLLDQAEAARGHAAKGGPHSAAEFVAAQTALAKVESLLADRPAIDFAEANARLAHAQADIAADKQAFRFVDQLADARELATQIDSEKNGAAFGRLASLKRLLEAYHDFGIHPGATPPRAAARKLLACPRSTHRKFVESLDFWLNEEPLGAGLYLHQQDGRVTIAEVIEGGTAYKQGQLRVGDRLLKIGNVNLLEEFTTSELRSKAYQLLSKPAGAQLSIQFVRGLEAPSNCRVACGGVHAEWARDVLAIIDPDPWRTRLRNAILSSNLTELQVLSQTNELETQPAFSIIQLAGSRFQLERTNEGIRLLEIAQQRHPDNFWANHYLGVALATAHDPPQPEESLRYLIAAVSLRPTSVGARMNLAEAFTRIGDQHSAHRHLTDAAQLLPGYQPLEARLRSLKAPPSSSTSKSAVATSAPAASSKELKTLEQFESEARRLARGGQRKAAMELLKAAESNLPGHPLLRRCKGVVLLELQDFAAARVVLSDAARLNPSDAASRFYHGVALQYAGDSRSAIHEYEAALQLRPDYTAVHEYLDPLRAASGQ